MILALKLFSRSIESKHWKAWMNYSILNANIKSSLSTFWSTRLCVLITTPLSWFWTSCLPWNISHSIGFCCWIWYHNTTGKLVSFVPKHVTVIVRNIKYWGNIIMRLRGQTSPRKSQELFEGSKKLLYVYFGLDLYSWYLSRVIKVKQSVYCHCSFIIFTYYY